MDRFLLVPTPDGLWKASSCLVARRSTGEEDLLKLHGQPILPPHDDAFLPDRVSLAWRAARILTGGRGEKLTASQQDGKLGV